MPAGDDRRRLVPGVGLRLGGYGLERWRRPRRSKCPAGCATNCFDNRRVSGPAIYCSASGKTSSNCLSSGPKQLLQGLWRGIARSACDSCLDPDGNRRTLGRCLAGFGDNPFGGFEPSALHRLASPVAKARNLLARSGAPERSTLVEDLHQVRLLANYATASDEAGSSFAARLNQGTRLRFGSIRAGPETAPALPSSSWPEPA